MKTVTAKLFAVILLAASLPAQAVELDPKAVVYQLPDQIKWGPVNAAGAQSAVLFGDPTKAGLYGVLNKWTKGNHFSRPHSHPNDRFITVISGTWWVGSGPEFDPDKAAWRCRPAPSSPTTPSRCTGTAPRIPMPCC